MTERLLRTHLVNRLKAKLPTRFRLADRALGVEGAPQTMMSPAWDVVLEASAPLAQRQRGQTRRRQQFAVRTMHAGVLTKGQDQWDDALDDEAMIRAALLGHAADEIEAIENSIVDLGSETPTMLQGGTYRFGRQTFHIDYTSDLPE